MYMQMLKYRLSRYAPHGFRDRFWVGERLSERALIISYDPDVFSETNDRSDGPCLRWDPEAITRPDLHSLSLELRFDAVAEGRDPKRCKDTDLIATVMAKGDIWDNYGPTYWGDEHNTLHLLVCGIDWSRFTGVYSATWSTFEDTYSPDCKTDVLSVDVTCRCDEAVNVRFGVQPPSLAQMFIAMSSNALEEVFDV